MSSFVAARAALDLEHAAALAAQGEDDEAAVVAARARSVRPGRQPGGAARGAHHRRATRLMRVEVGSGASRRWRSRSACPISGEGRDARRAGLLEPRRDGR